MLSYEAKRVLRDIKKIVKERQVTLRNELKSQSGADQQRDFDAFILSAKGETSTRSFQDWAGGERVTLAIVFTDVVGSTSLGAKLGDEKMNEVRRAHFAQSRRLIDGLKGREIKNMGDGFMVAFKSADAALDYAKGLQKNTGHPQIKSVRAFISGRWVWKRMMCLAVL